MASGPRHFIICGAQRSATTYLTLLLDSHPAIEMAKPFRPEPKFFLEPDGSLEDYRTEFFKNRSPETRWLGEKSTSYYEYPDVAARIAGFFDQPKLIFVLRDPIERAISNYHFSKMNGFETADTEMALSRELDRPDTLLNADKSGVSVSPQAYLARGRYERYLLPFFKAVPHEDICLLDSAFLTQTSQEKKRVFDFLSLEITPPTHWPDVVNASEKNDTSLSPALRSRLKDYFVETKRQMVETYGFDVSNWS